ncbi:DUF7710 domain-containing protein [Mucilaginibacter ginkgonis]
MIKTIWIFHEEAARFAGGVFETLEMAEDWIKKHQLSGLLTAYPLNKGVYDWALENGLFKIKKDNHRESKFIGGFTTAEQDHYHFENGSRE